MQQQTIVITGGTGTIGKSLTNKLINKGHKVIILSRNPRQSNNINLQYASWSIDDGFIDKEAIKDATTIIHLAGAGVADKRWTKQRKKEIVESRVKSGELLTSYLQNNPHQVHTFIASSAIGWYGEDVSPNFFTETAAPKNDFLGNTCQAWEQSVRPIESLGIRLVIVRTGIVLSNNGGALVEFKKPIQFGLATILGNGKQIISWISIQDLCGIYTFALENSTLKGIFNAVAPWPVSNKELTICLAKIHRGSYFIPIHVPTIMLKLILGEMSIEILKSTSVSASKIIAAGYNFQYPTIDLTLNRLKKNIAE